MNIKNKKNFYITLSLLLIFILSIFLLSYAYLKPKIGPRASTPVGITASCGHYTFLDGSDSINLTNTYPMSDNMGKKTTPYTFSVKNTCAVQSSFVIYLVVPTSSEIQNSYINYEFQPSNVTGKLTDIEKNQLMPNLKTQIEALHSYEVKSVFELTTDTLEPGTTKTYDIKLWVNKLAPNSVMNKTFIASLAVIDKKDEYTFADKILDDNEGKEYIDNKTSPTFNTISPLEVYTYAEAKDIYTTSMSSNANRTIGDGYTFNQTTGTYTLTNYLTNQTYSQDSVGKYTCNSTGYSNCSTMYKINVVTGTSVTNSIRHRRTPATYDMTETGLYKMDDDYTSTTGNNSYYFRGAVDNNWVKFGKENGNDIWWRIVRINGNGSVKLIYTGTIGPQDETEKVVILENTTSPYTKTQIGRSMFNTSYDKPEYMGYMYETDKQRGHVTSSTIKQTLGTWYTNNLKDYEEYLSDFIVCDDRELDGTWPVSGTTYSKAHRRNYPSSGSPSTPTLKCGHADDSYTITTSEIGNKKLTNPIGLLTVDEVTLAGAYRYTANNAYYLYTNSPYWLVSPYYVNASYASGFYVLSSGSLDGHNVFNSLGVRPVVSLSPDIKMMGSGKWNDPYRLPESFAETILANNGGKTYIDNKTSPTFTAVEQDNMGMYAMEDDYTSITGNKSYYFRGAVDNNWVKFGKNASNLDMWWRIVRINGDGSVKLIYTGTTGPQSSNESVIITGDGTQIKVDNKTTTAFNQSDNKAEYIGYMYEETKHRGHEEDSAIKDFIDTWYEEHFFNTDYEEYLSDFVICNDRGFPNNWEPVGLPTSGEGTQYSDVYERLRTTNTPQLICPHKEDRYTVNDTEVGNGELTYPIGLLTADEATLAGGYRTNANSSYYLYTNQNYWLVSPCYVNTYNAGAFYVTSSGYVSNGIVFYTNGVRPAVSLSSDLSVSGSGQWNDPYIVIE